MTSGRSKSLLGNPGMSDAEKELREEIQQSAEEAEALIKKALEMQDELSRQALKKMGAAQVYLTRLRPSPERPYLIPAVTRLRLIPKYHPDLRTAGVDACWRLYFNPEFVMQSSIELLSAIIEHEIWHLLLNHHRVSEDAGIPEWAATVWNIAADCEIHNDADLFKRLTDNGFEGLNHKRIGCDRKRDMIEYYNELMERAIIYKTIDSNMTLKTGVICGSYEVFINHQMPQDLYDHYNNEGGISVIYRGTRVK